MGCNTSLPVLLAGTKDGASKWTEGGPMDQFGGGTLVFGREKNVWLLGLMIG